MTLLQIADEKVFFGFQCFGVVYVAIVKPKLRSNEMNSTRFLGRGLNFFSFTFWLAVVCLIKRQPDFMLSFYEQIPSVADGGNNCREPHNYDLFLATEGASFMK